MLLVSWCVDSRIGFSGVGVKVEVLVPVLNKVAGIRSPPRFCSSGRSRRSSAGVLPGVVVEAEVATTLWSFCSPASTPLRRRFLLRHREACGIWLGRSSRTGGLELGKRHEASGSELLLRLRQEMASFLGSEELGASPRPMCHNRHGFASWSDPLLRFLKLLCDEASLDLRQFVLLRPVLGRRRTTSTASWGCRNIHLKGFFVFFLSVEVLSAIVPVHLSFLGLSRLTYVYFFWLYPYC